MAASTRSISWSAVPCIGRLQYGCSSVVLLAPHTPCVEHVGVLRQRFGAPHSLRGACGCPPSAFWRPTLPAWSMWVSSVSVLAPHTPCVEHVGALRQRFGAPHSLRGACGCPPSAFWRPTLPVWSMWVSSVSVLAPHTPCVEHVGALRQRFGAPHSLCGACGCPPSAFWRPTLPAWSMWVPSVSVLAPHTPCVEHVGALRQRFGAPHSLCGACGCPPSAFWRPTLPAWSMWVSSVSVLAPHTACVEHPSAFWRPTLPVWSMWVSSVSVLAPHTPCVEHVGALRQRFGAPHSLCGACWCPPSAFWRPTLPVWSMWVSSVSVLAPHTPCVEHVGALRQRFGAPHSLRGACGCPPSAFWRPTLPVWSMWVPSVSVLAPHTPCVEHVGALRQRFGAPHSLCGACGCPPSAFWRPTLPAWSMWVSSVSVLAPHTPCVEHVGVLRQRFGAPHSLRGACGCPPSAVLAGALRPHRVPSASGPCPVGIWTADGVCGDAWGRGTVHEVLCDGVQVVGPASSWCFSAKCVSQ